MRDDYIRDALKVVDDPNILVNVVSCRVKQLKRGNRPLVESLEKLSPEDTALREIIEGKISYELATPEMLARGVNHAMDPSPAEGASNQTRARSLLADLARAPGTLIPRRETIVSWLNACLVRSDKMGYGAEADDAADLVALDEFLRSHQIPVALESSG